MDWSVDHPIIIKWTGLWTTPYINGLLSLWSSIDHPIQWTGLWITLYDGKVYGLPQIMDWSMDHPI